MSVLPKTSLPETSLPKASRLPLSVGDASSSSARDVDAFLGDARRIGPVRDGTPRLVFALDATASRQPTWDIASGVQAGMFDAAAEVGGLSVQLVYFRGLGECRASRFVADPRSLHDLMAKITCRSGQTQIGRVLAHVREEAGRQPVKALVFVGDALEESLDELCATAGELGLVGAKAFMFHEGRDPAVAAAFGQIARLSGGAALRFDTRAPATLAALLRAVAAYAAGGSGALRRLAGSDADARRLIAAMPPA